jgi:hypothetical protein
VADDLDPQTWDTKVVRPRAAAVRIPPAAPAPQPAPPEPLLNGKTPQMFAFDPSSRRLTELTRDPIITAITNTWQDRQQHGRQPYEAMMKHPEVSSSFKAWVDFITANPPHVKPRARGPTDKQKEIAAFGNHLLARIPWPEFSNGPVAAGMEFGFSLSEISSAIVRWNSRDYVSLAAIDLLPQASLDNGYVLREELGNASLSNDPRYRCIESHDNGRVRAFHQFWWTSGRKEERITWEGPDLDRILHYVHRKGSGNPFGESILYSAFYAWQELYILEKIEGVFLDMALPVLIITYKTVDGVVRPALHDAILDTLSKQDMSGARRVLVLPDASGQSIAPSNDNFTKHIGEKKAELRKYIRKAIGMPESLLAENSETDADARNVVQVFLKHTLKARLAEIGALLEDLIARFVRANYRDLDASDFPVVQWSIVTENEVRVAQTLLAQIYPDLDVDKAPEVFARVFPFIEVDDFAKTPDRRVSVVWPKSAGDAPPAAPGQPPRKEPGSVRRRTDGQTENPSGTTNTSA